LSGFKNENNKL